MLNPDLEIDRLRWRLAERDWLPEEVDQICDDAASEINSIILDVVANASAEAIDHAESIGASDFLSDIEISEVGSYFHIATRSGKTDYSRDRKVMLPSLLKNAETAKDGTRYKVIPIRDKGAEQMKPSNDMYNTMKQMQKAQETARSSLKDNNRNNRSARANFMADQFRVSMRQAMNVNQSKPAETGPVSFRTATSKQDPNVDWVIPEKDMDLTQYLDDLNRRIDETIDSSVLLIIESYEKEFS